MLDIYSYAYLFDSDTEAFAAIKINVVKIDYIALIKLHPLWPDILSVQSTQSL